jgi:hypothetical protein
MAGLSLGLFLYLGVDSLWYSLVPCIVCLLFPTAGRSLYSERRKSISKEVYVEVQKGAPVPTPHS